LIEISEVLGEPQDMPNDNDAVAISLIPAAGGRAPSLKTCLELLKPVTWFAPIWAFFCGVISSGQPIMAHWPIVIGGLLLAGPMVCGTSQAVNDWYDRHVDAINEPNRPIPSGRMPGNWGFYVGVIWTFASLLLAASLGTWGLNAAIFALFLAWAYSAPPLRLKRNGWFGNAAVAICYEGVPWFTGAAIMAGALPDHHILWIALLYSIGAHGIMTLNDFKSIDGDLRSGINSLPALHGPEQAGLIACVVMALPQLAVMAAMFHWRHPITAAVVGFLLIAQLFLMQWLLEKPRDRAPMYNATGTSLYVTGMLICAFALAHA
jgi:chlorophyll synthase